MKSKLLLIAALSFGYGTQAQIQSKQTRIGVGVDLAKPVGTFASFSGLGYGGSVQGEYGVANGLSLTGSAGLLSFGYKKEFKDAFDEAGIELSNQVAIPLKAGARYYFSKSLYGAAELGASLSTGEGSGTAFVYSPGIGLTLPLSKGNNVDLGLRYEAWSYEGTSAFVGIRAAFSFGL